MDSETIIVAANSAFKNNDFNAARQAYETALTLGKENDTILTRLFYCYYKVYDYLNAEQTFHKITNISNSYYYYLYCRLPLLMKSWPPKAAILESLKRYYRSKFPYDVKTEIPLIINLLVELLQYDNSNIYTLLYDNLLTNYYIPAQIGTQQNNLSNLLTDKIAIFSHNLSGIKFILPVLKLLPEFIFDIVLEVKNENDCDYAKNYGINYQNIKYGIISLKTYSILFIDQWYLLYKLNPCYYSHAKIVSFTHAMDAGINLTIPHGVIAFYSRQYKDIPVISMLKERPININHLDYKDKCELCVTGPFHFGEFYKKYNRDKLKNRLLLEKMLKINIDNDKPVIVFFEDEISNHKHIERCLNDLSKDYTIIAKMLSSYKYANLSSRVILYDIHEYAPNILRFAADFILCGKQSGTFMSSLMYELPVIPYYSRVSRLLNGKFTLTSIKQNTHPASLEMFLATKYIIDSKWPFYFDLLKTDKLKRAISDKAYLVWYKENIKQLKKELFGCCNIHNPARQVAENLIEFAATGSFGNNCSAVYFKKMFS